MECLIFSFYQKKDLYNTNMSYYNLCGIGSQHSNILKGKRGGTYKNHCIHYSQIRGRSDFFFRELTWRSGRQQREVGRLLREVKCD
jgi:hypothetical protein